MVVQIVHLVMHRFSAAHAITRPDTAFHNRSISKAVRPAAKWIILNAVDKRTGMTYVQYLCIQHQLIPYKGG